jgi:hypothetical protein
MHVQIQYHGGIMKIVRLLSISIALVLLLYSSTMAAPGNPIKTVKKVMKDTWGSQFLKKRADKYFCASERYKMKVILESKRKKQKMILKELKKKFNRKYIKTVHNDISQLKYRVIEDNGMNAIVDVSGVIYFRDKETIFKTIPLKRRFVLIVEKGKWKICDFQID